MTPATCSEVTPMNGGSLVCAVDVGAMTSAGPAGDSAPTMVGIGALVAIGVAVRMARSRPKAKLPVPVEAPALRIVTGAGSFQLNLAQTIAFAVLAATILGLVIGAEWHML